MAHNTPEFHEKVEKLMKKWLVPGLAIAVVVSGEDTRYTKVCADAFPIIVVEQVC